MDAQCMYRTKKGKPCTHKAKSTYAFRTPDGKVLEVPMCYQHQQMERKKDQPVR